MTYVVRNGKLQNAGRAASRMAQWAASRVAQWARKPVFWAMSDAEYKQLKKKKKLANQLANPVWVASDILAASGKWAKKAMWAKMWAKAIGKAARGIK